MDPDTVHIRKLTHSQNADSGIYQLYYDSQSASTSKMSNYEHRLRSDRKDNYPNGYLEDWSSGLKKEAPRHLHKPKKLSSAKTKKITANQSENILPYSSLRNSEDILPYTSLRNSENSISSSKLSLDSSSSEGQSKTGLTDMIKSSDISMPSHMAPFTHLPQKYTPVSVILSTQSNILLNKDNNYSIRFSTGMIEGSGVSVNDNGNEITFHYEGSYRFEICGEATPFSEVGVKLVFYSPSFSQEVQPFSEINVPKDDSKLLLRGLATILPLQKDQKISPRLIPVPDESIVLMSNTRLIIHRVA